MSKIPFTVSARTARLIGSENFSNAEGAVIELVKNSYDADANFCYIIHDDRFSEIQSKLSVENYEILKKIPDFNNFYTYNETTSQYILNSNIDEKEKNYLQNEIKKYNAIYIIDNGSGMDKATIISSWMVIGTQNKKENVYSLEGRIQTGAKGIGRFALDRLGNIAQIVTFKDNSGIEWSVNWGDFDNAKVINQVEATIENCNETSINSHITQITKSLGVNIKEKTNTGTIIKISELRDDWDRVFLDKLNSSLESLMPPFQSSKFAIYLNSTTFKNDYGLIKVEEYTDYDYKLNASIEANGDMKLEIDYNEFDLSRMPPELYSLLKDELKKIESENKIISIFNLNPGLRDSLPDEKLEKLGKFHIELYFLKQGFNYNDDKKYYYKHFNSKDRKDWLDAFSGIKIFRDNFRVRPYGEHSGNSFDWLGLSARVLSSPEGIGRGKGGYKMGPKNLAGIVQISRLYNGELKDVSNRAGIQEGDYFELFKVIIISVISKLEKDRTALIKILYKYNDVIEDKAEIPSEKKVKNIIKSLSKNKDYSDEAQKVYSYIKEQKKQIDELISVQKMLRILASGATTISAFAHELKNIKDNLVNRVDDAEYYVKKHLGELTSPVEEWENPYFILTEIKEDEIKLKEWLGYALGTLRRDKRKRLKHNLIMYLNDFYKNWNKTLSDSKITIQITPPDLPNANLKIFETDLDCIFNNLISNSLEAFERSPREKIITIDVNETDDIVSIIYSDNGNGLSKDLLDINQIFEAFYTTKRDSNGKKIGTGMGMWLLKSFVDDNNGDVILHKPDKGFSIEIKLPKLMK